MPADQRCLHGEGRPRARYRATWPAVAALLGTVALGAAIASNATRDTALAGDDWRLIDARGSFTFRVPPDMQEVPVRGIDSYVGRYESASCRLEFDYGFYSDPLRSYASRAEYTEENVEVGGRAARLVGFVQPEAADGRPFSAAIHFADVGLPPRSGFGATRLTLFLDCRERADLEVARPILHSVRFPPR